MNAAGPAAAPTTDQIMKAVRTQGGNIRPSEYSKFIGALQGFGFRTKAERPHEPIPVSWLVEKLKAFEQQGGTAAQMITALRAAGI